MKGRRVAEQQRADEAVEHAVRPSWIGDVPVGIFWLEIDDVEHVAVDRHQHTFGLSDRLALAGCSVPLERDGPFGPTVAALDTGVDAGRQRSLQDLLLGFGGRKDVRPSPWRGPRQALVRPHTPEQLIRRPALVIRRKPCRPQRLSGIEDRPFPHDAVPGQAHPGQGVVVAAGNAAV